MATRASNGAVCAFVWATGMAACMTSGGLGDEPKNEAASVVDGLRPDASAGNGNAGGSVATEAAAGGSPQAANNANAAAVPAAVPGDGNLVYELRRPWALVGRFDLSDANAPRFALPNSRIGIRFTGTSLSVQMSDSGSDAFDVSIDGVDYQVSTAAWFGAAAGTQGPCLPALTPASSDHNRPGCLLLPKTSNPNQPVTLPVAVGLAPGEHVAWFTKRTEFAQGAVGMVKFFGVTLDEGATLLAPPPYRRRRIEIVGDSSTTGYGSAQQDRCGYSERNSNGNIAFAGALANFLKAEVVNASSSGQGVYYSVFDQTQSHRLPVLYSQLIPREAAPFDFSEPVDVVFLSAGGDDLWGNYGSGYFKNPGAQDTSDARANFVAAYVAWLADIRGKRPDASIICMLSYNAAQNDQVLLGGALQEAVTARNQAGDANVVYFSFYPQPNPRNSQKAYQNFGDVKLGEGFYNGCSGHPSPPASQWLASVVGPVAARLRGWTDTGF